MKITGVLIEEGVKEKILSKHNVEALEIKQVLLSNPLVLRSRLERYIAIGRQQRYLTIVFEYHQGNTLIVTAYPSSDAQIKLYLKKKK